MDVKELIGAIQAGQSQAAQKAFESIVADKVTAAIDARTQEVASSFGVNESEQLDEISLKTAVRAHTNRTIKSLDAAEYDTEGDMGERDAEKAEKTFGRINKKFGASGAKVANSHVKKAIKNSEHSWVGESKDQQFPTLDSEEQNA